ncbi:MAG: hypothetical protein R3F39_02695 [Myxococcota bacterium]
MWCFTRVWVGLALLVATVSACAADGDASCSDASCGAAETCREGRCEPVATPQTTGDLGRYTRVAVRPDGRLVIATYDSRFTNLVLRTEESDGSFSDRIVAGWRFEDHRSVDADAGRWPSVAVAADGAVHLTWYDAYAHALMWGRSDVNGGLQVELVDGGGDTDRGTHSSIALGEGGRVHVAYRDHAQKRLRYAERAPGGGWESWAIDGCPLAEGCGDVTTDRGEWASLGLVAGEPRIAFYDRARGDLDMAIRDAAGEWRVSVLDGRDPATGMDSGDVGRFASLALDPKRRVGIAYYDATRGQLRYLAPDGATSGPVRVDDGVYSDAVTGSLRHSPVGQHVTLRYSDQGSAHLIYLDAGRLVIRHATVSGVAVTSVADLATLAPGGHLDFQVTPDKRIRGAYGAWVVDGPLKTELATFDLPLAGAP